MAAWYDRIPRVRVPKAKAPKPVTFIVPYYCNAHFFAQQLSFWRDYPGDVCAHVSAVVVDDGSPDPAQIPGTTPFALRLFRIQEDRRWNWLAARNIGAHHAADGWLLLTDMDHVVPPETAQTIIWGQHDPRTIYLFSRREHTGDVIAPHSASYLMTRQMFWAVGGYDEAFSGVYGSDGEFRRRCAATAPLAILTDALVRYEFVADSSTTRYTRKEPADAVALRAILAARGAGWRPKTLSFAYTEVTT